MRNFFINFKINNLYISRKKFQVKKIIFFSPKKIYTLNDLNKTTSYNIPIEIKH
jgi:hypothetical protein